MQSRSRLAAIGGLAIATAAFVAAPTSAIAAPHGATHGATHQQHQATSVVFVENDDVTGNAVIAYDRASDGTLTQASVNPTGGLGGVLDGSVVDHTASQGSLTYDKASHTLYAVNAGSNTLTVFAVDGDQLTRTQVLSSGGTFPVSVTAYGNHVYVLNALDEGSVQGFARVGHHLRPIPRFHRSLELIEGTPQFTHTPSQITVSPNGRHLLVATKAASNSIDVFSLAANGRPSRVPVVNNEGGAVPFAIVFDAAGRAVVTDAAANAVDTFRLGRGGILTMVDQQLTGQVATCWIARTGDNLYASNAGSANLSGYADSGSGSLTSTGTTATDPGTVDAAASSDGRFLYVQTGANGIVDEFSVGMGGALTQVGSIAIPNGAGGEGIVAL